MCSQRARKHPRTNILTPGNLIDRRKYAEHVTLDQVDTILSIDPLNNRTLEPLQEEERERVSEEILLANLQADFLSLNLSDRNIPVTMPALRSTETDTAIPQHIRQVLETADLKAAALLAEASQLCSKIINHLQPHHDSAVQPSREAAFPGSGLMVRLREIHNILRELNVEENKVANALRLDIQSKVEQKLSELDDHELLWTIKFSGSDPLPPDGPSLVTYDTSKSIFFHSARCNNSENR